MQIENYTFKFRRFSDVFHLNLTLFQRKITIKIGVLRTSGLIVNNFFRKNVFFSCYSEKTAYLCHIFNN